MKIKLIDSNIIITGLVGEFNPQQHFTENKSVKYWRGNDFNEHVLNPVKTISSMPDMNFSKHQFTKIIYDKEIMEHFQISESTGLMTREEILWVIVSLTSKQPNGEAGTLLNNGDTTIIGYMLCDDGVIRTVRVCYKNDNWLCGCFGFGHWSSGYEVFSRNFETLIFLPLKRKYV